MTLEKTTKIIMKAFVIFVITMLLSGCVTKKKLKESQELQSTYILDQNEIKWTNSVQNLKSDIKETLLSEFNETLKEIKESKSTNENESTDISVNIKAEDGKEKSATVGNTTIKSNGADITVKTTSTKQENTQLETLNKELTQTLKEERNARISLQNEFNEFKSNQLKVNEELKAELNTKTKETNKKAFNLWFITPLILAIILYILYRLRNRFSAFNKLKGFFIPKK